MVDVTAPWTVLLVMIGGVVMILAGSVAMSCLNRLAGVALVAFGCGLIAVAIMVDATVSNAKTPPESDMLPAAGQTTWRECADAAMDAATERATTDRRSTWPNIKLDYDLAICDRAFPEEGGGP